MLPGLLLQDSWRYSFFALGRGSQAFLNDTIWTLTLCPPLLFLRSHATTRPCSGSFRLGCRGDRRGRVGPLQARVIPRLPDVWAWVSQHRDLGLRYLAEGTRPTARPASCASTGSAPFSGLAAVGYVQAAGR